MANFERKNILLDIAEKIKQNKTKMSEMLTVETGKPIKDSKVEVDRAISTFTIAAEESVRFNGEFLHLDMHEAYKGKKLHKKSFFLIYSFVPGFKGFLLVVVVQLFSNSFFSNRLISRFPVGLVSMIVPFNFPINLAAHKVAPAIATGCPFVVKPSEKTPWSITLLGEILSETNLPDDSYAILPCHSEDAKGFSDHDAIKFISFTGSAKVGWQIKGEAKKKKVVCVFIYIYLRELRLS